MVGGASVWLSGNRSLVAGDGLASFLNEATTTNSQAVEIAQGDWNREMGTHWK